MTKQLAARQKETSHIYPQQYQNDQARHDVWQTVREKYLVSL